MVVRLAKYNVYRYIGCINDQSNWSGPFSLVVMTPDFESEDRGFKPRLGHSTGNFSLHVYFSSYYTMGALFRFLSIELPSHTVNL